MKQLEEYDSKKYEVEEGLPSGEVADGVIVQVNHGPAKGFIQNEALQSWKGDPEHPTLQVVAELHHEGKKYGVEALLSHNIKDDGVTILVPKSKKSNMRKYLNYYKKLPAVGDKIKCSTNSEGYWQIMFK